MIINNKVIWSDEELADMAYQDWQRTTEYPNDIEKYSFIKGFVAGLNKASEK
jgi:hypothetical protein